MGTQPPMCTHTATGCTTVTTRKKRSLEGQQDEYSNLREEFQQRLEEHEAKTREGMQEFQKAVITSMQELMKTQLEAALRENLSGIVSTAPLPPRKKQRTQSSSRCSGHACRICGAAGADVHRHRDLGIYLDGKCRKQVETFRNGGVIMERREEWSGALLEASHSDLSRRMRTALGQVVVPAEDPSCQSSIASDNSSYSEPCSPLVDDEPFSATSIPH